MADSVALIGSAVGAQVAFCRQVEQPVAAVALAHHRSLGWREFKLPLALVRVAFRAFQIDGARGGHGNPLVTTLDAERHTGAVLRVVIGMPDW